MQISTRPGQIKPPRSPCLQENGLLSPRIYVATASREASTRRHNSSNCCDNCYPLSLYTRTEYTRTSARVGNGRKHEKSMTWSRIHCGLVASTARPLQTAWLFHVCFMQLRQQHTHRTTKPGHYPLYTLVQCNKQQGSNPALFLRHRL